MRSMRFLIVIMGLLVAMPGAGIADVAGANAAGANAAGAAAFDWRPVQQQTTALSGESGFRTALPIVLKSLDRCPQAVTPVEAALCTAAFSDDLAAIRERENNLPASEAALRQALAACIGALQPNDKRIGEAHAHLALFFQRHGRPADEVASLLAAEAVAAANGPALEAELAALMTHHAGALEVLGKAAEAAELYHKSYKIVRAVDGPLSRDALITLGNWFSGQVNAGAPDAAIQEVMTLLGSPDVRAIDPDQRALLAGKLALSVSGPARAKAALVFAEAALPDIDNGLVTDADSTFALLDGAARLQAAVGDPNQAAALARRARDMAAAHWGPDSLPAATALRTEAAADAARHDSAAAAARLSEAAAMLRAPTMLMPRTQVEGELGQQLALTGQRDQAIAGHIALAGSDAVTAAPASVRASVLTLIGQDLVRLGAPARGAAMCGRAAELAAGPGGLPAEYAVKAELCVGNAADSQGRFAEAGDAARHVRELLWQGGVAPAEPAAAFQIQAADLLARSFQGLGLKAEALATYREEEAIAAKAGDTVARGAVLSRIALVQRQMGALDESDRTSSAALTLLGTDGPSGPRADLLNNRALVAAAQGRFADAVPLFQASLALRRQPRMTDALAVAAEERDLAAALESIGHNAEAGRHMDLAIEGFRALGPSRSAWLMVALDRRVAIATAAGEPARAESALRELISLRDPASDEAAAGQGALADLLDNQGRRTEAAALRAKARAIVVAKHGADSVEALRQLLSELPSLRSAGRLAEADSVVGACDDRTSGPSDMVLACLTARTEADLDAGRVQDAVVSADKAVTEAEIAWTHDGDKLVQALMLRIRAAAAAGDSEAVLRLFDRVHGMTPDRGPKRVWTDIAEGRTLIRAGQPGLGVPILRFALRQSVALGDSRMAVSATSALAEHALSTGRGRDAIDLWRAVLPMVPPDAPADLLTVLDGLGKAADGLAEYADAARFFRQAADLSGTAIGRGAPQYRRMVAALAEALTESGEPARAEDALRLLNADPTPAALRQQTIGLIHLAQASQDPFATRMLGHQLVTRARIAFGPDSVAAAFATLDRIEIMTGSGKRVDPAELADAMRVILAQDASWHVALRVARLEGLLAAQSGLFGQAAAAFKRAETIAIDYEGPHSLDAASEVSNQAGVKLKAGDVTQADALFQAALTMAAPDGAWQNPVWARIAGDAAVAADRNGDLERANKLRERAGRLAPSVQARDTVRWP